MRHDFFSAKKNNLMRGCALISLLGFGLLLMKAAATPADDSNDDSNNIRSAELIEEALRCVAGCLHGLSEGGSSIVLTTDRHVACINACADHISTL